MSRPVIGVIEWSGGGSEPAVFLGLSAEQVRREIARFLVPMVARDDVAYVDPAWLVDHPAPSFLDPAAVSSWLDALREATTDAWVTVYHASDDGPGCESYHDVRRL